MDRRLNVAVIGLGVGEQHALAYHGLAGCRLRWLHDLDTDRALALRDRLGEGEVTEDEARIFEDPEIDLVSIASFDDHHFGQVIQGIGNRKHLFVEKPLCRNIEELGEIKKRWNAGDRTAIESNLVLRAAPAYVWLRDAIRSGEFGEVYAFDGDYLYGRMHKITEGWRKDVPDYSVMTGGGIHLIDLMMWMTGQCPDSVATVGNRICTEGSDFRYDDFMASTYLFDSGLVGRITANFGCVHRHQHVVRLFGGKATFIHDDLGVRVHWSRDPETPPQELALSPLPDGKGALIPGFVDSIRAGADTAETAQLNFDLISVCVATNEALGVDGHIKIHYV